MHNSAAHSGIWQQDSQNVNNLMPWQRLLLTIVEADDS